MKNNMREPDGPQMTVLYGTYAATCWITQAADIHSECVILTALLRQQISRQRISMLRLYVHCLST